MPKRGDSTPSCPWTKYEKQLRRLFCFLIYQHPRIGAGNIEDVIEILAEKRDLYPQTFIVGTAKLSEDGCPAVQQTPDDAAIEA